MSETHTDFTASDVDRLGDLLRTLISIQRERLQDHHGQAPVNGSSAWSETAEVAKSLVAKWRCSKQGPPPLEIVGIVDDSPDIWALLIRQQRQEQDKLKAHICEQLDKREKMTTDYLHTLSQEMEKVRDGRISSKAFRLDGQVFDDLTPFETDLLDVLWDQGRFLKLSPQDAMKQLYGPMCADKLASIKTHKTNLHQKLFRRSNGKWSVSASGGLHLKRNPG